MVRMFILILTLLLFCGCNQDSQPSSIGNETDSSLYLRPNRLFGYNSIFVFRENEDIEVIIEGEKNVSVKFTPERKPYDINGITLIGVDSIEDNIGKTMEEIVAKWGEIHGDMGSGPFIPVYITTDGYMVYFKLSDDVVCSMSKQDLFTGTIVEKCSLDGIEWETPME